MPAPLRVSFCESQAGYPSYMPLTLPTSSCSQTSVITTASYSSAALGVYSAPPLQPSVCSAGRGSVRFATSALRHDAPVFEPLPNVSGYPNSFVSYSTPWNPHIGPSRPPVYAARTRLPIYTQPDEVDPRLPTPVTSRSIVPILLQDTLVILPVSLLTNACCLCCTFNAV